MGKGTFPVNLSPRRAQQGFAVQPGAVLLRLGVRDPAVWGDWAGLGSPLCLPLQGGCSSTCKILGWFEGPWGWEGWGLAQGPPTLPQAPPLSQGALAPSPWSVRMLQSPPDGSCEGLRLLQTEKLFKPPVPKVQPVSARPLGTPCPPSWQGFCLRLLAGRDLSHGVMAGNPFALGGLTSPSAAACFTSTRLPGSPQGPAMARTGDAPGSSWEPEVVAIQGLAGCFRGC